MTGVCVLPYIQETLRRLRVPSATASPDRPLVADRRSYPADPQISRYQSLMNATGHRGSDCQKAALVKGDMRPEAVTVRSRKRPFALLLDYLVCAQ